VRGGVDGLALIRTIRVTPLIAHLRIIVLSASVAAEDVAHAFAAGCDAFLARPCLPSDLLSTVQQVSCAAAANAEH
jgi:CheY-like chemotaxis protein